VGSWVSEFLVQLFPVFKAITMKTVPPITAEGIERHLGSGLVKGIGPTLAKKLVGRRWEC